MAGADTKDRILDAAERCFAEAGFNGTSLRTVTARAGVNLAAVHYHFGSKDGLFQAVFCRRLGPLNEERLLLLRECEARAGRGAPHLEGVLEAFVTPVINLAHDPSRGGPSFVRLVGRLYSEPGERWKEIFLSQFQEVKQRFGEALGRALPDLPQAALFWRMHFAVGALAQTLLDTHRLDTISGGLCDERAPAPLPY
ncbi:MAG: TetR/AcrR family transcriptional regulator [Planctomycetota bacterium]